MPDNGQTPPFARGADATEQHGVETAGSLETALAHACTNVPITEPHRRVADVRLMLAGRRYDSASHVVVREGTRFAGIVRIEDLLAATDDAAISTVMDAEPPTPAFWSGCAGMILRSQSA